MTDRLMVWTIFDHPRDAPDHFVTRRFEVVPGEEPRPEAVGCLYDTLDEARSDIPGSLVRFDRHPTDDPVIVEAWL